jgi:hypothetical protein
MLQSFESCSNVLRPGRNAGMPTNVLDCSDSSPT